MAWSNMVCPGEMAAETAVATSSAMTFAVVPGTAAPALLIAFPAISEVTARTSPTMLPSPALVPLPEAAVAGAGGRTAAAARLTVGPTTGSRSDGVHERPEDLGDHGRGGRQLRSLRASRDRCRGAPGRFRRAREALSGEQLADDVGGLGSGRDGVGDLACDRLAGRARDRGAGRLDRLGHLAAATALGLLLLGACLRVPSTADTPAPPPARAPESDPNGENPTRSSTGESAAGSASRRRDARCSAHRTARRATAAASRSARTAAARSGC